MTKFCTEDHRREACIPMHTYDCQYTDAEPDNPTAHNLATWIADHTVAEIQQAFRLLGMRMSFDLIEDDHLPTTDIEKIIGHADDGQWHDVTHHRITAAPVDPEAERLATQRAEEQARWSAQAAADMERITASGENLADEPDDWCFDIHGRVQLIQDQQQRIHELESLASDTDRLRRDWTEMRNRAEKAEALLEEVRAYAQYHATRCEDRDCCDHASHLVDLVGPPQEAP